MKAIGYVRVSSDKQADSGLSLEAQAEKIRAYAKVYDLDIIRIEVDAGVSAKTLDRPALQRAIDSAMRGEAQAIVVAKLDRLTRSIVDWNRFIELYLMPQKFALMSVGDQIDTRNAAGRLVLNVLMAVAQWEREAIAERTRDAYTAKRARGERWGAVPYGWRDVDGRLEHDPDEWELAEWMRSLRSTGHSLRFIAAHAYRATRSGKDWTAEQVRRICVEDRG